MTLQGRQSGGVAGAAGPRSARAQGCIGNSAPDIPGEPDQAVPGAAQRDWLSLPGPGPAGLAAAVAAAAAAAQ